MIRLFDSDATNFDTNGIGLLDPYATECTVDEEINGLFELSLTYPTDKQYFSDIKYSNIIMAKPNPYDDPEPFRIYRIDKNSGGKTITASARHLSYQLSFIPIVPFSASNLVAALALLKDNATEPCPFKITSKFNKTGALDFYEPRSMRSAIGDGDDSILSVYGGEVIFSGYDVTLVEKRGEDRGFEIRYGKDLMSVDQEESIENTITGVMPFWKKTENITIDGETYQVERTVYLQEKVVHTDNYQQFPYPRTIPLNLSQVFSEPPTQDQLRMACKAYIEANDLGKPEINLSVSYVDLRKTEEYKNVPIFKEVKLGDTIKVHFAKLGVKSTGRVVATHYDVIKDEYSSIDLGKAQSNLSTSIATATNKNKNDKKKDKEKNEVEKQQLVAMVNDANASTRRFVDEEIKSISGLNGGFIRINSMPNDETYELLIMDAINLDDAENILRFNNEGVAMSNSGYSPANFRKAISIEGELDGNVLNITNINAQNIKTGTMSAHNGDTTLDFSTGVFTTKKFVLDSELLKILQNGTIKTKRLQGGMDSYDSYMNIAGAYMEMGVVSHSDGGSAPDDYNENYFTAGALDGTSTNNKKNSSYNLQSHGITFDIDNLFVTRGRRYIGITPTPAQPDFPLQGGTGSIQIGNQTITFVNGVMVTALT